MSFGANNTTKAATNNLGGVSNLATNNLFPAVTGAGSDSLKAGTGTIEAGKNLVAGGAATAQPGIDFFKTILAGNRGNTTATLQPNIDQIREGSTGSINAINTLMPRGGGRSAALTTQSFAPQKQIQDLFNTSRTTAATALPQIGLQQQQLGLGQQGVGVSQQGVGANLFNIGQGALGTAGGVNSNLAEIGQKQQQISNSLFSGLGQGLFGILTTPFGGGSAANGLLGMIK